jgi:hypothetical protein
MAGAPVLLQIPIRDNAARSSCGVSRSFPAPVPRTLPVLHCSALWDTGSTGCAITDRVIKSCGLEPEREVTLRSSTGTTRADRYLVNLYLPNGHAFVGVRATRVALEGVDVLIGMDVIMLGEFKVGRAPEGGAFFSFLYPPGA